MTLTDWSDYHAWDVSPDAMKAARLALSDKAYAALFSAAILGGGYYLVKRDAIEAAALAMLPEVGIHWLAVIYQLDSAQGVKLMNAIHLVHRT